MNYFSSVMFKRYCLSTVSELSLEFKMNLSFLILEIRNEIALINQ